MKHYIHVLPILFVLLFTACSGLRLTPANFAWAVESVLPVDENGTVNEERYSISFNTSGVFFEEFGDSSAFKNYQVRLLRDNGGFYFLTGNNFKNVYVFTADDGSLLLDNKIRVSETGLNNPALNQRTPFIELIYGENSVYLTRNGIKKDKK